MINEERLLKTLYSPVISEKTSNSIEKKNTIVFRVARDATKAEIKTAVQKLFEVEVNSVNTLITKKKFKRRKHRANFRNSWKKAFISLKKGQKLGPYWQ